MDLRSFWSVPILLDPPVEEEGREKHLSVRCPMDEKRDHTWKHMRSDGRTNEIASFDRKQVLLKVEIHFIVPQT